MVATTATAMCLKRISVLKMGSLFFQRSNGSSFSFQSPIFLLSSLPLSSPMTRIPVCVSSKIAFLFIRNPLLKLAAQGPVEMDGDAFEQTKTINSSRPSNDPECLRTRVACLTLNTHLFVHRKFFLIQAYDFISDLLK